MKKLLTNLITSKISFFLFTTILILSLNLIPLIAQIRHAPAGRTFALIHNNVQDFFFYQSLMNEGGNGQWLTTDPYTTEPHQPSIIFAYFLWLGKLSKLLALPNAIIYHLTRIILGIFFLFSIFYFLFSIRIPYPRLAFFFFLFAAPFLHKVGTGAKASWIPYMNWWTGMDPIRRVAYLPHHMFGSLLLVITVIIIIKYFYHPKTKYLVILILSALLLAFVHTPSLFILLIALPPAIGIYYLIKFCTLPNNHLEGGRLSLRSHDSFEVKVSVNSSTVRGVPSGHLGGVLTAKVQNFGFLVYWFIGLFFLFLMLFQTQRGFPWSQYIAWEKNLQFPLVNEIFGAFGILLPFSIIGIVNAIRLKRFEYIFAASWLVSPLLLIPFAQQLNISNVRLIQGTPYLPLAILAVLGIDFIEKIVKKIIVSFRTLANLDRVRNLVPPLAGRKINNTLRWISQRHLALRNDINHFHFKWFNIYRIAILIVFLIFTLPTLSWSLKDQIGEYWPIYSNVYLDNRLKNAFVFISQYFPRKIITLSTFYTGNYLPVFTNTTSYLGHFGYTYNIEKKETETAKFFSGKMKEEEAKDFLLSNKTTLIFQGPEEKLIYYNYLYPTILKTVYDQGGVTLYVPNLDD